MSSVTINPPKTPVTKGSNGIAAATVPNVCKMPGPPAPFVPTPLPNIGKSGNSPKGFSKKVKIEGQPVAIQGASFGSTGDVASQGTGGGIVSSNVQGPTKFIGPGSLNVRIEGKSVQLLGDQMLNNCGPSGSPANSATLAGLLQDMLALVTNSDTPNTKCVNTSSHCWEAKEANSKPSLKQKISDLEASLRKGLRFEARAAIHNMATGELKRSSQLGATFRCANCGLKREADQLHDGPTSGSAPIVVEAKKKSKLGARDLCQLGRNIQTLKQGGASGLVYKIPSGKGGDYLGSQINAVADALRCTIRIVKI